MSNTKRWVVYRIVVEADDENATPLKDVVEFGQEALLQAISSEGWEVKEEMEPLIHDTEGDEFVGFVTAKQTYAAPGVHTSVRTVSSRKGASK